MKILQIQNKAATAKVSLYGGQILSYIPDGGNDVLWLSKNAQYQNGKAIRGGIPICWPWFGPRDGSPSHGYARTNQWELIDHVHTDDHDSLQLALQTPKEVNEKDHGLVCSIYIEIGDRLMIKIVTENLGLEASSYSAALHSYFSVGKLDEVSITGLENSAYFDKVNDKTIKADHQSLKIEGFMDRVYHHPRDVKIFDPYFHRVITVRKENFDNTVVWNPGLQNAAKMTDIGLDLWNDFVCVEAGNILPDRTIAPGEKQSSIMEIHTRSI